MRRNPETQEQADKRGIIDVLAFIGVTALASEFGAQGLGALAIGGVATFVLDRHLKRGHDN